MTTAAAAPPWQIWIDTGGTFTDCLALDGNGGLHRAKVLSTGELRGGVVRAIAGRKLLIEQNWCVRGGVDLIAGAEFRLIGIEHGPTRVDHFDADTGVLELNRESTVTLAPGQQFAVHCGEEAPVLAARLVTGTTPGAALPPLSMRLGTTRATNALLERRGRPTALFITRGFGDLLLIGDQQRPDLFALTVRKRPPLQELAVEVDERLAADGTILRPLDLEETAHAARRAREQGIEVAAIALMHSYRNPVHELALAKVLRRLGFTHVSCSSQISPLIRIVPRAATSVVDAYLSPVIDRYLETVRTGLGGATLHVMTSAGGLVNSGVVRASEMVLSGPAGGVAGAASAGRRAGFARVIGFDMGGTSTDVARFDGDYEYAFEQEVAGVRMAMPALAIETVAAGGGSICEFVDGELRVGPRSAGARPGPACYGCGGPLTLTDVNLALGRLDRRRFEIPIFPDRAEEALRAVLDVIERDRGASTDRAAVLEGLLEIANERMADAIAQVSLRRGFDPREYALVAFGGAGGQHACAVAERLGIGTIIMPADAALLSALGLGHAAIERIVRRQVLQPLEVVQSRLGPWMDEMADQATEHVAAEGVPRDRVGIRRQLLHLRLTGQDHALAVDFTSLQAICDSFVSAYRAVYGHEPPTGTGSGRRDRSIEVEALSVVASEVRENVPLGAARLSPIEAVPRRRMRARFEGVWMDVDSYERDELPPGARLRGPALILDRRTTCVIESGWSASVDADGAIIALRAADGQGGADFGLPRRVRAGAMVTRELFASRFRAIAQEMGQILQRTALSTNVKERLDFSCALLDAEGELLANAPHMPVHLGSMGMCVRAVRNVIEMRPGDVIITNHPAFGGSHLPDITVITPVFVEGKARREGGRGGPVLFAYVASRAHHAEIGGTRPGSMPPTATTLAEEGVVIAPMKLIDGGRSRFDALEDLLRSGPHPSRAVDDNLADVSAQVAANVRGAVALNALAELHGHESVAARMSEIKQRAAAATQEALKKLTRGRYEAIESLDDGSPIRVCIEVGDHGSTVDFTGSAAQHPGNLNATPAIVRSAVIYVLRLLIGQSLPLNEGIMRVIEVVVPPGMLNPAFVADSSQCPAVAGGNTETSQRVVDTLLKALGVAGSSQGTMNNTLWGNDRFAYYETVCGGSGATADGDGADVVQTHMTNTRITDPEVLEHRYPVRLDRFAVRRGSGGAGRHRGGDGAVREVTFLEPMQLSILSQHRKSPPYGAQGGSSGACGRQRVIRADGVIHDLKGVDGCDVRPGDRLMIETPSGGGFGAPVSAAAPMHSEGAP